jgi:hypothetical protein
VAVTDTSATRGRASSTADIQGGVGDAMTEVPDAETGRSSVSFDFPDVSPPRTNVSADTDAASLSSDTDAGSHSLATQSTEPTAPLAPSCTEDAPHCEPMAECSGLRCATKSCDGTSDYWGPAVASMVGIPRSTALGDLNGDGHLDILVGSSLNVESGTLWGIAIFLGKGNGALSAPIVYDLSPFGVDSVLLTDLNGAGRFPV